MPNWCFNQITFSGSESNLQKMTDLFAELQAEEVKEQCGQKPLFVTTDNYFFGIQIINEETIHFESRWSPLIEECTQIAKELNLNFQYTYEECGNQIFGKAIYTEGDEEAEVLELESSDYDLFDYDEENDTYNYKGEIYLSDFEILENIWEAKFHTNY